MHAVTVVCTDVAKQIFNPRSELDFPVPQGEYESCFRQDAQKEAEEAKGVAVHLFHQFKVPVDDAGERKHGA